MLPKIPGLSDPMSHFILQAFALTIIGVVSIGAVLMKQWGVVGTCLTGLFAVLNLRQPAASAPPPAPPASAPDAPAGQ